MERSKASNFAGSPALIKARVTTAATASVVVRASIGIFSGPSPTTRRGTLIGSATAEEVTEANEDKAGEPTSSSEDRSVDSSLFSASCGGTSKLVSGAAGALVSGAVVPLTGATAPRSVWRLLLFRFFPSTAKPRGRRPEDNKTHNKEQREECDRVRC